MYYPIKKLIPRPLLLFGLIFCGGCSTVGYKNNSSLPVTLRASSELKAYSLAQKIADRQKHPSVVCKIWNTGSMWPNLDAGCIVVRSDMPFNKLEIGHIVHVNRNEHEEGGKLDVVHRIVASTPSGYVLKGDAKTEVDSGFMSRESYSGMIVAIIRFKSVPYRTPITLEELRKEEMRLTIKEQDNKIRYHLKSFR
jgi:hypothetical protein